MALRSGYKGFKKLLPGLKLFRPGTLGIDNGVLIPELNKTFFPRSEQAVLGAKNRITFPYLNMVGTIGSLAVTVTNDGIISIADGTVSANDTMALYSRIPATTNFYLPKGRYKFTVKNDGTITGGTAPYGYIGVTYNGSYKEIGRCNLNGELEFTIDDNFQCDYKLADGSALLNVYFQVFQNNVLSGFKIKPMISFDGGEFVPPAMTNRELSEKEKLNLQADGTIIASISSNDSYAIKGYKLAIANMRIKVGTYASWTNAITGLPKPKSAVCAHILNESDGRTLSGIITTGGNLQIIAGTADAPQTDNYLLVSASYIYDSLS